MPNSFDYGGRGPSDGRLFLAGVAFVLITFTIASLLIAKYKGKLDPVVRVSAEIVNVGDGLPTKSDVKFRGVLVGFVSDVVPAKAGQPNVVRISLDQRHASGIPETVTARVVPSNVFAVSSVQLVDNGRSWAPLRTGAVIHEDRSLPTVLFQSTLSKFRQLLLAVGREPNGASVGWVTAVGEATQGRGQRLQDAGHDLNEIVRQLNSEVGDGTGVSTLSSLIAATNGLRDAEPELFDALAQAVRPMQTLAEKRSDLHNFLSAGLSTFGTVGDGFDHQTDRLIAISTQLTPVVGTLADRGEKLNALATKAGTILEKFLQEGFNPANNTLTAKGIIALTPTRTYVRSDCPHYGALAGPSCQTAPEVPVAPALGPALGSRGLPMPPGVSENRPNFAPPRGSVLPPDAQSAPPDAEPTPATEAPASPGPVAPNDPGPPPDARAQSAIIGGNVGPVGSRQEKEQLSRIIGGHANAATEFLLGPLARGATVHLAPDPRGNR